MALITPLDEDEYQCYLREYDPAFIKSIARARKQAREGKVTSIEEIKRRLL